MNTIRNYLDNMFIGMPQTKNVLRAKDELFGMMEDKYEELKNSGKTENEAVGIVISEFGNLDELAEVLDIRGDLDKKSELLTVSYDRAKNYLHEAREVAPKTAKGVFLLIMSPVLLIFLYGLIEISSINMKEEYASALGLTVLLLMVALGVSYLMRDSNRLDKYEDFQKMPFKLNYQTELMVRDIQRQDEPTYRSAVSVSVFAYIVSALPVIISSLLTDREEFSFFSTALTLIIVAAATYNIINNSGACEACKILLQEEDYSVDNKTNKVYKAVSSIYWSIAVAVYLGYSFITNKWDISWVIWPVSGVLFGALRAIAQLTGQKK